MTTSGGREVAVGVPYRRPQTPDLQLKLNKKCLFLLPKAACSIRPNHSRSPVCVPPRDAQTNARSTEIQPAKLTIPKKSPKKYHIGISKA